MGKSQAPLLQVSQLQTFFRSDTGTARAVNGVSFTLDRGQTLGLVGESGCGKSVTALSIMGLVPSPPGYIEGGGVWLEGQNLLELGQAQMRQVRGSRIGMIFQEPMTSLNPVLTCGYQIGETLVYHQGLSKKEAGLRAVELLELVGIPAPHQRVDEYPHQLSGGMRQRIMIAMALACSPDVLIADEPTTALDVTVQAQILDLLERLQEELRMAILLITHDFGVVAEMADRVAVMYGGQIVESAPAAELLTRPRHPYTQGLLRAVPRLDGQRQRLAIIPGVVPDLRAFPPGCSFAPRCPVGEERCNGAPIDLSAVGAGHWARCWKVAES